MKHTPTPWSISEGEWSDKDPKGLGSDAKCLIAGAPSGKKGKGGQVIIAETGDCPGGYSERTANAELIVRAVNSHKELLAALHKVNYAINLGDSKQQTDALDELKSEIRQVIAKAEGK